MGTATIAWTALALGALTACVGAAGGPLSELPDSAAEHLRAGAKSYGGPLGAASPSPLADDAFKAFDFGLSPASRPLLSHDGSLDLVARAMTDSFFETQQHTTRLVAQWMAWRAGSLAVVDKYRILDRGRVGGGRGPAGMETLGPELDADVTKFAATLEAKPGVFGVSRQEASSRWIAQAVVVGHQPLTVEPIAKTYALDEQATIHVKSLNGYTRPTLYLDVGNGVGRVAVETTEGGGATATFVVASKPARVMIELRASPPTAPEVQQTVLRLPLYVGMPEPETLDAFLGAFGRDQAPSDYAAAIRSRYNAIRVEAARPALAADPPLQAAVDGWAQKIAGGGSWSVQAAGAELESLLAGRKYLIQTTAFRASGDFADFVAERMMSPYARSAIIAPGSTLAVGVAALPGGGTEVVECLLWNDAKL